MYAAAAVLLVLLTGCRKLPRYLFNDTTLARAGESVLRESDVRDVVPQGITGDDSAAFMQVYIDRWIRNQLKLQEAEQLFSSSEQEIERKVEEYRQSLLIQQLDRYYVDRSLDTLFTDEEIAAYYDSHFTDFRSDRTLVKGRVVQFPERAHQARMLKTLMESPVEARQRDLEDLCAKNGFELTDMRDAWVDYSEFLSHLPTLGAQNYDALLGIPVVQEMRDTRSRYYFQITAVRRAGEALPLERVRPTIRRILFNQRQGEIIRLHEEELYARAVEQGEVRIHDRRADRGDREDPEPAAGDARASGDGDAAPEQTDAAAAE